MDFRFKFNITGTLEDFTVADEDTLKKALDQAWREVCDALEINGANALVNLTEVSHEVVSEILTARVTNIRLYTDDDEDIPDLPEELIVEFEFDYDNNKDYGSYDSLTLDVYSAAEDLLERKYSIWDASIRSADFEIIKTESGEPFKYPKTK